VFLDIRGYLSKKKFSPYYNVAFGFTNNILVSGGKQDLGNTIDFWNQLDSELNLDYSDFKTNPGLYFQPTIGMSVKAKSLVFLLDVGVQISNLNYTDFDFGFCGFSPTPCTPRPSTEQEKVRRVVLRFGIML